MEEELENKLDDILGEIDEMKSEMATQSQIERVNERLSLIEKKFQWLRDEILGYLQNNT